MGSTNCATCRDHISFLQHKTEKGQNTLQSVNRKAVLLQCAYQGFDVWYGILLHGILPDPEPH